MRASRHPRSAAARVAVFALVAIAAVAACGGSSDPTAAPSATTQAATPAETSAASEGFATTTPGPATVEPATPEPTEPAATNAPPTAPPGSEAPSGPPSSASNCSGSDDNRDFFADAAAALDWRVYCGVLPRGWFVQTPAFSFPSAPGRWYELCMNEFSLPRMRPPAWFQNSNNGKALFPYLYQTGNRSCLSRE
jgi:hypothetical protein